MPVNDRSGGRGVGLAVIGCGTTGRIRARLASENPGVHWLGVCDLKEGLAAALAADAGADYVTTDFAELIRRPEVTAVIVATDENAHVEPALAALEHGRSLLIEKPLATDPVASEQMLRIITERGADAVVGYTQRFRRRFLTARQRIRDGQIGDVTTVVARAFMNRMVPMATLSRTGRKGALTPMVVSGTHSVDVCLWLLDGLAGKQPVEVYARAGNRVLGGIGTLDSTLAVVTLEDGTLWSMNINWALPVQWPGSVYGLQVGVVGTRGVIEIEDTHRDAIVASELPQGAGYQPEGFAAGVPRHVDFLGSYPPGDLHEGALWGPMREETTTWIHRLLTGAATPHATAAEAHRNLVLTMAMDLSARTGEAVPLPVDTAILGQDETTPSHAASGGASPSRDAQAR
jgi:myo-inositol 2-dehydrogenase / D-chiro-inositol 1-dehydrogenase